MGGARAGSNAAHRVAHAPAHTPRRVPTAWRRAAWPRHCLAALQLFKHLLRKANRVDLYTITEAIWAAGRLEYPLSEGDLKARPPMLLGLGAPGAPQAEQQMLWSRASFARLTGAAAHILIAHPACCDDHSLHSSARKQGRRASEPARPPGPRCSPALQRLLRCAEQRLEENHGVQVQALLYGLRVLGCSAGKGECAAAPVRRGVLNAGRPWPCLARGVLTWVPHGYSCTRAGSVIGVAAWPCCSCAHSLRDSSAVAAARFSLCFWQAPPRPGRATFLCVHALGGLTLRRAVRSQGCAMSACDPGE